MARACLLFSLVCVLGCSSLHLRAEPSGREVGQEIGSNVRDAAVRTGTEAGQYGGKSDLQDSYADTIASKELVLVNTEVNKVIRQANGLAASLTEKDFLCQRRWSGCPDGWALVGEDQCRAPASYGGACRTMQSFVGKSVAEKQQLAEECKAPWPCDDCAEGRDYVQLCPDGWSDAGAGYCEAPSDFETKCATSYDFAGMDVAMKQELAATCGFNWKCNAVCAQDFSASCPEGWEDVAHNGGLCAAPVTYSGVCGFSANTTRMTNEQKGAFAKKCATKWPCLGAAAAAAAAAAAERNAGIMPDGPIGAGGGIVSALRVPVAAEGAAPTATKPQLLGRDISKMFLGSGPVPSDPA